MGVLLCGLQGEIVTSVTNGALTDDELRADPIPVTVSGISQTSLMGIGGARFTSADQSAADAAITDAPTTGEKIVLTDIVISAAAAMRVDLKEETSGTVIASFYLAANSTVSFSLRGKAKLPTADKKLMVRTSASGNISVTPYYYSEA